MSEHLYLMETAWVMNKDALVLRLFVLILALKPNMYSLELLHIWRVSKQAVW